MIHKILFLFITLLGLFNKPTHCNQYICGDVFRSFANHIFDERLKNLVPNTVKNNDIIFVKTDYLEEFFNHYHPRINFPYILITHNSDYGVPGRCQHYLDDPKLIAWFGQNVENFAHPKLIPIPIGIANPYWAHGNQASFRKICTTLTNQKNDHYLVYINFTLGNYPIERNYVYRLLKQKPFCYVTNSKPLEEYLREMSRFKFVASPRGNGLDCHRTWEALLVRSIPIVKTSFADSMYNDLPVLIINSWEDVTEEFLQKKYSEIQNKYYNFEKLFASYWFNLINEYKR